MATVHIPGFEISEKISESPTAVVWLARQLTLERTVALKVLRPEVAAVADVLDAFQQDVRRAASLKHPAIIRVYDAACADGIHYVAMEHTAGTTLGRMLRSRGAVSEKRALAIARNVAQALDYVWTNAQMAHGDLKPDDIVIDQDGSIRVAELGLTRIERRWRQRHDSPDSVTNYMAPELLRGDDMIDCCTDVYSLGAILYHMLVGVMPFKEGSRQKSIERQLGGRLPNPRSVTPNLSVAVVQLLTKMMMRDPGYRYQTWGEVLRDMDKVIGGSKILFMKEPEGTSAIMTGQSAAAPTLGSPSAPKTGAPEPTPQTSHGPVVAIIVVIALAVFLYWLWRESPAPAVPAPGTGGQSSGQAGGSGRVVFQLPAQRSAKPSIVSKPATKPPAEVAPPVTADVEKPKPEAKPQKTPRQMADELSDQVAATLAGGQYQDAQALLDAALKNQDFDSVKTDLAAMQTLAAEAIKFDAAVEDALRKKIGRFVTLRVNGEERKLTIKAVIEGRIDAAQDVLTDGGWAQKHLSFKVSQIVPQDRLNLIVDTAAPDRAAMKFLLCLQAGQTNAATEYAQKAGPMAPAFARLLEKKHEREAEPTGSGKTNPPPASGD